MEGLGKILGNLGGMQGIGQGLGAITSLFGLVNQFSQAQKEKAVMDRSIYYSKHPEAVSNMVAAATKPLSTGLTTSVSNVVNANLAEQGLSQAPGIQTQNLAQALAPYQQNEQKMALDQVLSTLGLPIDALKAIQSTMNPMGLAQQLSQLKLPGSGSQGVDLSGISLDPVPGSGMGSLGPLAPPGADSGTFGSFGAGDF